MGLTKINILGKKLVREHSFYNGRVLLDRTGSLCVIIYTKIHWRLFEKINDTK